MLKMAAAMLFGLVVIVSIGCGESGDGTGGTGGTGGSGGAQPFANRFCESICPNEDRETCIEQVLSTGSCEEPIVRVSIESEDRIVSEDGEFRLTAGTISIRSISLISNEGEVLLLGPTVLDLTLPVQEVPIQTPPPSGSYTGLHVELAPSDGGSQMLDVQLQTQTGADSVRAISQLVIVGDTVFPEGTRGIANGAGLELHLLLTGMFFYLSPLTDAVDGIYEVGPAQQDGLTMDLINMFDLRVLP